jgi:hypothetical protein
MGFFGFLVVVGLLVFSAVTTRRLVRRRRGAFRLVWWLLLLEFIGAVLFVGSHDMAAGRNMGYVFARAYIVLLVWTAPNALLLYRWRWKFLNAGKKSRAVDPAFVSMALNAQASRTMMRLIVECIIRGNWLPQSNAVRHDRVEAAERAEENEAQQERRIGLIAG